MPSIIKVDQIQSDQGFVNVSSNLQFSSGFSMLSPSLSSPTLTTPTTSGVMTLGAGIKFPATQVTDADGNTLDDYEEGTWTPIDGSGAGLTFAASGGRYVKIGRLVQFWFRAQYPSTSNTNQALITGLPYAGAGQTASFDVAGGWNQFFSQNANSTYEGYIGISTTTLYIYNMISNQTTALNNSNVSTVNLYAYGSYYAAA